MGWIKIALVSAVGVYSFRSVTRVNHLVKQVNVPRHSLLDKYSPKVQALCLLSLFLNLFTNLQCVAVAISLFLCT